MATTIILGHQRRGADTDDTRVNRELLTIRGRIFAITPGRAVHDEGAACAVLGIDAHLVARAAKDVVVDIIAEDVAEVTDVVGACRQ